MKIASIVLVLFCLNSLSAQENCSKFYPLEEGASFQYTSFDKKGKNEGSINYTISAVSNKGSATVATFELKYLDKKGKNLFESNYNITCENGTVKVDYSSLFPSQMMKQYEEMGLEMDISGTDIELPNDLSVGQELSDARVAVAMNMAGIKMNIEVNTMNRKVEKKETVTTAAGTFDCYLITETTLSKTMGANIETQNKLWLAEGVGMIKQETYKKNGNLMSRSELTKYSK